jgi:hypothetical protein
MIVAWHEVPGTAPPQESRPVGYGMIRAGVRTDSKDWREEISDAVSLSRIEITPTAPGIGFAGPALTVLPINGRVPGQ